MYGYWIELYTYINCPVCGESVCPLLCLYTGGVVEGRGEKGGSEGVATGSRRRKRVKRLKSKMYTTDDGAMGEQ